VKFSKISEFGVLRKGLAVDWSSAHEKNCLVYRLFCIFIIIIIIINIIIIIISISSSSSINISYVTLLNCLYLSP